LLKIEDAHIVDEVLCSDMKNMPNMYGLEAKPFGTSWQEWTTKWWQWFLSIQREKHPAIDETGENCHINQTDHNVWFLAGTVGGVSRRTIRIAKEKAVLVPVINVTISYSEYPSLRSEDEMMLFTQKHIDGIGTKEAYVDGFEIQAKDIHRVKSPLFDFYFPRSNIFGAREGHSQGVGDGYWIFLKPLSQGKHNIYTFGSCLSGKIQIGVNVELIVDTM